MTNNYLGLTLMLAVLGTQAAAGGLERTIPRLDPLFEKGSEESGRYLEFSLALATPELSGDGGALSAEFGGPAPITGTTGDLLEGFANLGAAYKARINDSLSYALIFDQPIGASTAYPVGTSPSPIDAQNIYGGSSANVESFRLSTILAYNPHKNFKLYAGPVVQSISADATVSFLGYNIEAGQAYGVGYLAGAAYELEKYAVRVALTYRSAIEHNFDSVETVGTAVIDSDTVIETPQSLTLDFQTGIAPKTLLFGQVHWVDWSEFEIAPPNYPLLATLGRPLVAYEEDWITYTLGVGRQFTDTWGGRLAVTWEPQTNTEVTSLGPVDGRWQIAAGVGYEDTRVKIAAGLSYSFLGDGRNVLETDFSDGTALGAAVRFGFKL